MQRKYIFLFFVLLILIIPSIYANIFTTAASFEIEELNESKENITGDNEQIPITGMTVIGNEDEGFFIDLLKKIFSFFSNKKL